MCFTKRSVRSACYCINGVANVRCTSNCAATSAFSSTTHATVLLRCSCRQYWAGISVNEPGFGSYCTGNTKFTVSVV